MLASLSLISFLSTRRINSLWLTWLKRQVWLDSFDRRHQVRPVWFHFLIWPEDISIIGRNPPEESEATNLNRVKKLKKHHMSKHFRRITTTKNVQNKSWLVSKALLVQCVLFARKSKGLVPMNPSSEVVKWWYWWPGWYGCVFRS